VNRSSLSLLMSVPKSSWATLSGNISTSPGLRPDNPGPNLEAFDRFCPRVEVAWRAGRPPRCTFRARSARRPEFSIPRSSVSRVLLRSHRALRRDDRIMLRDSGESSKRFCKVGGSNPQNLAIANLAPGRNRLSVNGLAVVHGRLVYKPNKLDSAFR
jgi:hypothetical protein